MLADTVSSDRRLELDPLHIFIWSREQASAKLSGRLRKRIIARKIPGATGVDKPSSTVP